ncbi:hypothetical protein BY996DRAFT_6538246, partial [Phakopsora pachyrhizi]
MSAFFIDSLPNQDVVRAVKALNFQTYHVRMTMKLINKHGKEGLTISSTLMPLIPSLTF